MSKPFKFKEFSIIQDQNPQKIGTDSMILGAWIKGDFNRILDIGTGTGILALMQAQLHTKASITAIEPQIEALNEAAENFRSSPFSGRIMAIHSRLQDFSSFEKFDLIITNPPYFNQTYLSQQTGRNMARHSVDLQAYELYQHATELLAENGTMAVVIPHENESDHLQYAFEEGLYPQVILRTVSPNGNFKRSLIKFSFTENNEPELKTLAVKDANNKYTPTYIELTKAFHAVDLSKS